MSMSQIGLSLRIVFDGKKYFIERFPDTRQELQALAIEKLKLSPNKDVHLQYLETPTDKVVIADDADLSTIRQLALAESRRVIEVLVEKGDDRPAINFRGSSSTAGGFNNSTTGSRPFDPERYYEFLQGRLPEVKKGFEAAMLKGIPCQECHGQKKLRGAKCDFCCGKGYRPISSDMQLILDLIDYKIREYVMGPLEMYCCKSKDEEACLASPPIEKTLGGPSPRDGQTTNNINVEPIPSQNESVFIKASNHSGLRPAPGRHNNRNSEMYTNRMSEGYGNRTIDPRRREDSSALFVNEQPARKSSSKEDFGNDLAGRPSFAPNNVKGPIVPEEKQNNWVNKKSPVGVQDSINNSIINRSLLSQDQSHVSTRLQSKPAEHQSLVVGPLGENGVRDINNKTMPITNPLNQSSVKGEVKRKELKFEVLNKNDLKLEAQDAICKIVLLNKSAFTWRTGMTFSLALDIDQNPKEEHSLTKEILPEESAICNFDLRKYIGSINKSCKADISVVKNVDEIQRLSYFSEKTILNIEFV